MCVLDGVGVFSVGVGLGGWGGGYEVVEQVLG